MAFHVGRRPGLRTFVRFLSALALVLVATAAGSPARVAAQTIEGTWNYGTGQIVVTPLAGGGFVGVITKTATFSAGCPHPVGEKIWHLQGSGTHFEGTHEGFGPNGCDDRQTFPAVWDISEDGGDFQARECTTITTDANRVDCSTLVRAKPPAAPARTRSVAFSRAYAFFPGSAYVNKVSRSYARARGTVTVPTAGGKPACLVRLTGLESGVRYSVQLDANGAKRGDVSTAGPWRKLGTFRAAKRVGTFRCGRALPSGGALYVNVGTRVTILISGRLP